jgi:hypothetical protein
LNCKPDVAGQRGWFVLKPRNSRHNHRLALSVDHEWVLAKAGNPGANGGRRSRRR